MTGTGIVSLRYSEVQINNTTSFRFMWNFNTQQENSSQTGLCFYSHEIWGKSRTCLQVALQNASIFELLYFGNLSISLASSRLLPYSSPLSLSLPLSTGKLESNLQVLSGAFYFITSRRKWVAKITGHSSATLTQTNKIISLWRCGPTPAKASSFTRFIDHTQTHHSR